MRTLGVDTGGTFTDLIARDGEDLVVAKLPSTPAAPAEAVLGGLDLLGGAERGDHVVHGTTVALNALLTGNTARVALVATEGFCDTLEIGRQDRPDIYALEPEPGAELVPRRLRFEVPERIWPAEDADGSGDRAMVTVKKPTKAELKALAARVRRAGADSIAVCLLHSYADPRREEAVRDALAGIGLPITTSADILPEHREVERFSTAVVNAALVPLMHDYLAPLSSALAPARLSMLQSNGGTLPAERAATEPVRVLLSGPAGGVVGAARAARQAGFDRMVGFDMGGTSTDVSFHDSRAESVSAGAVDPVQVGGFPVGVPSLDIHTIGCGGGSLVTVDEGGVLHVGPESAGADPGPVAYGDSDRLTITDAHVMLGHVAPGAFLGGKMSLDIDAVTREFERLGSRLGIRPREAARAVLEVARAAMRRAIGVMTMQRGQDPAGLPLVAFGGAGGLHGAALAASLGMQGALVPRFPGALSACGMATADALREHALSPLAPLAAWGSGRRAKAFRALDAEGKRSLREAGHAAASIRFEHKVDLRYRGQSFELQLSDPAGTKARGDLDQAFHRAHEAMYGYALADREIELVCLRSRAVAASKVPPAGKPKRRRLSASAVVAERGASFVPAGRGRLTTAKVPVIARDTLVPGTSFAGPALVEEYSGTTLVPPGWRAAVTAGGHLFLAR